MSVLQTSTSVVIPLVSAIIGGTIAVGGNAVLNWNQRRIERNSIRRTFTVEVAGIKNILDRFPETPGEKTYGEFRDELNEPYRKYIITLMHPQFDENRAELKNLPTEEIDQYLLFYGFVDRFRNELEMNEGHFTGWAFGYLSSARIHYRNLKPYLSEVDDLQNEYPDLEDESTEE